MHIQSVKERFHFTMSRMSLAIDNFPWESRRAYSAWLAQSYFFVKHSTRLLALAAANCSFENNKTHKRMGRHIFEEIGHEILAANDLANLGIKIDEIYEHPLTKAFYRLQYYGVQKMGPSYLMGYILFLEGLASIHGPKMLSRITGAHGTRATTFLKLHVEEDVGHVESAFENMELSNTAETTTLLESLEVSCSIYTSILNSLKETSLENRDTDQALVI